MAPYSDTLLDRLDWELGAAKSRAQDADMLGERLIQYATWCQERLTEADEKVAKIEAASATCRQAAEAMSHLKDPKEDEIFQLEAYDLPKLAMWAGGLQKAVDDLAWNKEQAQSWSKRARAFYDKSASIVGRVRTFAVDLRSDIDSKSPMVGRLRSTESSDIIARIAADLGTWATTRHAEAKALLKHWEGFIDESGGDDRPFLTMHVAYTKELTVTEGRLESIATISASLPVGDSDA